MIIIIIIMIMIQFSLVSEISANQNPSTMLGMEDGSKIELSTTVNRSIEGGKREKNEARERERRIYIYIFVHEAFFTDRSPVDGDRGLMGLSLTLINSSSERDSLYYAVI